MFRVEVADVCEADVCVAQCHLPEAVCVAFPHGLCTLRELLCFNRLTIALCICESKCIDRLNKERKRERKREIHIVIYIERSSDIGVGMCKVKYKDIVIDR